MSERLHLFAKVDGHAHAEHGVGHIEVVTKAKRWNPHGVGDVVGGLRGSDPLS